MRMHLQQAPTPASQMRPGVPVALDQVVGKALAKAPAARYQRAEDMIPELEMVGALATLGVMGLGGSPPEPKAETGEPKSGWRRFFGRRGGGG